MPFDPGIISTFPDSSFLENTKIKFISKKINNNPGVIAILPPDGDSYKHLFEGFGLDVLVISNHFKGSDISYCLATKVNLKAIVFTGGDDISPSWYNEIPDPLSGPFSKDRDQTEFNICSHFVSTPKIGICRGLQVLHISNGGKLLQHIEGHRSNKTEISVANLGRIMTIGDHHQAVKQDVLGCKYFAYDPKDGMIEGAFYPKTRSLGVQWHPEWGGERDKTDFINILRMYLPEIFNNEKAV